MIERNFNEGDLNLCSWQYEIRHTDVNDFVIGEKVFLKSNPEHPMVVHSIGDKEVICEYMNSYNPWSPECILQYKFAGLVIYKNRYKYCLN